MTAPAFVDTHVHFWDHGCATVRWAWLEPGWVDPHLGDIDGIRAPRYRPEEFLAEADGVDVAKVVHVQAAVDTPDPVAETAWLEEAARRTGLPNAIVAHSDLRAPGLEAELERHAGASPRLRGIRDFSSGDYMVDPAFDRGLDVLERFDLLSEIYCDWTEMPKLADLARRHPALTIVLEHAVWGPGAGADDFDRWAAGIDAVAAAENVHCKISGHGMGAPTWTVASLRPWVLHCLQRFGVERCVLGGDWPVERLFGSYAELVDAYAEIAAELTPAEQRAVFSVNAETLYRI